MNYIKITLVFLISILLTGCWDSYELEEQAYVVAIGIDKGGNDNINVTFQIANPQVGSSDRANADNEPPYEIITLSAPDKISARDLANISVSRRITFSHSKNFIISEEIAKSDMLISFFEAMIRDPQMPRNVGLIISKEKASEFISNNNPKLETRPHKHYEFMGERYKETGLVPISTISKFIQRTEEDAGGFLAIYATIGKTDPKTDGREDKYEAGEVDTKGGNPIQMIGSAVLKEGRMIGSLTGEETRLTLLMRPHTKANRWFATYPDPIENGKHITTRLIQTKRPKIDVNISKDIPKIDVEVPITYQLLLIRSFIDYVENQEILEKAIEEYLDKAAKELIEKSQKELEADIFQWSLAARKEFLSIPEWDEYNWMEKFPESEVNVHFDVTITEFGEQLEPIDLEKIKD